MGKYFPLLDSSASCCRKPPTADPRGSREVTVPHRPSHEETSIWRRPVGSPSPSPLVSWWRRPLPRRSSGGTSPWSASWSPTQQPPGALQPSSRAYATSAMWRGRTSPLPTATPHINSTGSPPWPPSWSSSPQTSSGCTRTPQRWRPSRRSPPFPWSMRSRRRLWHWAWSRAWRGPGATSLG
jgi:hypothetical protein